MRNHERYSEAARQRWVNRTDQEKADIGAKIKAKRLGKPLNITDEARLVRRQNLASGFREWVVTRSEDSKTAYSRKKREVRWSQKDAVGPVILPYLRQGMSVREIAGVTKISPSKIYPAKSALRRAGIFSDLVLVQGVNKSERREKARLFRLAKKIPENPGESTLEELYKRDNRLLPNGKTRSSIEIYYSAKLAAFNNLDQQVESVRMEDFERIHGKVEHINPRIKLKQEIEYIDAIFRCKEKEKERKVVNLLLRGGSIKDISEILDMPINEAREIKESMLRRRELMGFIKQKETDIPDENHSEKIKLARELVNAGFIGNLKLWHALILMYTRVDRDLPKNFSERLRLEAYLVARLGGLIGKPDFLKVYDSLVAKYPRLKDSLSDEELFIRSREKQLRFTKGGNGSGEKAKEFVVFDPKKR